MQFDKEQPLKFVDPVMVKLEKLAFNDLTLGKVDTSSNKGNVTMPLSLLAIELKTRYSRWDV